MMKSWIVLTVCVFVYVSGEDFPSLITANASIAVVLDHQFLGDEYQTLLDDLKDYIKELARDELKHGGVNVHYFSWTSISLKKGYLAVFSIASCEDTWSLFSRTEEEELLLFALTEVDCPRLPADSAITVTYAEPGQELPQLLLDLRSRKAFDWKSAIILHDNTLNRDMISRVVQSLTSQIKDEDVSSVSVTVFKMRHEVNEYLKRKEVYRVLSRLPVKYIGENFIAIVKSDVMATMAETARQLRLTHTGAQWLFVVDGKLHINDLYEGENIAYIFNTTSSGKCKNGILCYAKELMNAFISALDSAVQEEFDVAAQVSDEEWEAIRPTKLQRRDTLLKHMQQYISVKSKCGNCSTWRALAADTWGATYVDYSRGAEGKSRGAKGVDRGAEGPRRGDEDMGRNANITTALIENIHLLPVGTWRPIDGISFDDVLFPHVEHGFRGRELPIISYHNPPWTILQINSSGSVVSYSGLLFDIVNQLAKNKNFTIRIILPGHLRQNSSNDTATDMMHSASSLLTMSAIARGQAALAVAAFTVLPDFNPGINFTIPVSTQPYSFMIARPRELSRALLFLLPFTTDTWLCLGFAVLLMGPMLYIVHRLSPYYEAMEMTRQGGLSTIHNCLWYIYGALLQQGGMYLPRADSGRLVVGTWWIVVLVVVTTYSGNLVAFLTFPKLEIPVTTVSELLESKSYTWTINKGSFLETQLKNSEEPKYLSLLKGAELTSGERVASGSEVLERVRFQRHALIDWKLRLSYIMRAEAVKSDSCNFAISSEEFMDEQVAMIVPAGSPYLPVINKEINRMQKAGLITKWLSVYLPKRDRCWMSSSAVQELNNHTVNLSDMQGSFFVLFLAMCVAILGTKLKCHCACDYSDSVFLHGFFSAFTVLLAEWMYNRRKKQVEQVVIKPYIE